MDKKGSSRLQGLFTLLTVTFFAIEDKFIVDLFCSQSQINFIKKCNYYINL